MPRPALVLIGPPGSGKSTVATVLAQRLGLAARDTDGDVEERAGMPVAQIFVDLGEEEFRRLEREAVATALRGHDGVLALGGGAVLDPATQEDLRGYAAEAGVVVFLDVSLAHAAPRVGFNQSRPLLLGNPRAQWQALMDERRPTYEALATHRVSTDARTPQEVAAAVQAVLGGGES